MVARKRLTNGNGNGHAHDESGHDSHSGNYGNRNWDGDGSVRHSRRFPDVGEPAKGRYSLFSEEHVRQARKLAELGHIDIEIAKFFGIGSQTFRDWLSRYPQLAEALKVGKETADNRVERSLYTKAVGFYADVEKIFCSEGAIVRAKTKQYFPPDSVACIFWLKNRCGWTDRAQIEFTPAPGCYAEELRQRLDKLEVPNQINLGPGEYKRVN